MRSIGSNSTHTKDAAHVVSICRLKTNGHLALSRYKTGGNGVADVYQWLVLVGTTLQFHVIADLLAIDEDVEGGFSPALAAEGHP